MSAAIGVVGFALLFALFGTFVLPRHGSCHGDSCDTCEGSCDLDIE